MNRAEVLNKRLETAQSVGVESITPEKDVIRVVVRSSGRNQTSRTVLIGIASAQCNCPDPSWVCKHRLRAIFEVLKTQRGHVSFFPDRLSASIATESLTDYDVWVFGELWAIGK